MSRAVLVASALFSCVVHGAGTPLQLDVEARNLKYDGFMRTLKDPSDELERSVRVRARPYRSTGAWLFEERIPLEFSDRKGKPDVAQLAFKKEVAATDEELEVQLTIVTRKGRFFTYLTAPKRDAKKGAAKVRIGGDGWFRVTASDEVAWPELGSTVRVNTMCEVKVDPKELRAARSGGDDLVYDDKGNLIIDVLLKDKETDRILHVDRLTYEAKGNAQLISYFTSGPSFLAREGKVLTVHASFLTKKGKALVARGEATPRTMSESSADAALPMSFVLGTASQAVPKDAKVDPLALPAADGAPQPAVPGPAPAPAPAPALAAPAAPAPVPSEAMAAPAAEKVVPAPEATPQPAAKSGSGPLMGRRAFKLSACERSCERSRKACYCPKTDASCASRCDATLEACTRACGP